MKNTKKIIAGVALMAMLAGISACSKEEVPPPAEAEGTTTVTTEAEQKEEPGQITAETGSQDAAARFTKATMMPRRWCRRRSRWIS